MPTVTGQPVTDTAAVTDNLVILIIVMFVALVALLLLHYLLQMQYFCF